jgi:hypothetical protein
MTNTGDTIHRTVTPTADDVRRVTPHVGRLVLAASLRTKPPVLRGFGAHAMARYNAGKAFERAHAKAAKGA